MKMNDVNFSFREKADQHKRRREIMLAPDGGFFKRKGKKPWKITDAKKEETARWKYEKDQHGRATLTEQIKPTRFPGWSKSERSVFELEIIDGCLVGGFSARPGDKVIGFLEIAQILRGDRRAKVLSETRNAF